MNNDDSDDDNRAQRAIEAALEYFKNTPVRPLITYGDWSDLPDLSNRIRPWEQNVIWAKQDLPKPGFFQKTRGIFLAGPTRRHAWSKCDMCNGSGMVDWPYPKEEEYDGPAVNAFFGMDPCKDCKGQGCRWIHPWRQDALEYIRQSGFKAPVYVPEPRGFSSFESDAGADATFDHDAQVRWERSALRLARVILFWIPRTVKDLPGFTTNIEFGEWSESGKCVLGWPAGAEKMAYIEHVAFEKGIPSYGTLEEVCKAAVRKHG